MGMEVHHVVDSYVRMIKMLGILADEGEPVSDLITSTVRHGFVALGRAGLDVFEVEREISGALRRELDNLAEEKRTLRKVLQSALNVASCCYILEDG